MNYIRPACALFALLLSCCASIDSGVPGVSKEDVRDAIEMGTVLPGMSPRQVRFVWDAPRQREGTANGEKWVYEPDAPPSGRDYHPMVTVFFVQGKVDHVINGDLKKKRAQVGFRNDIARRAPRGGFDADQSSGLQSSPPPTPGISPALRGY